MKKHSRLTALIVAIFMLLGSAACSRGGAEETTEIAATTAPETTEAISEETTEESSTVVATPETTNAPETEPPKPAEILRIIMQDGRGEAILSALADEKTAPLLDAREKALLYEHSAQIELSKTEDLESHIKNHALAGDNRYDLVLTSPLTGIELLSAAALENLAGAGISITSESIGVGRSITESLSIGDGVYLFASDALVSDIGATYAIRYSGRTLSSDPIEKALAGEFTVELMLTYISELENAFAISSPSPLTLFHGVGGQIFCRNEKGVPSSAVNASTSFGAAYSSALTLYSKATEKEAFFTLEKIAPPAEGEIYLPIPKANSDMNYSAPIDHDNVYLFAAPVGVISGNRLNTLVTALASCSNDYREAVRGEIIGNGSERSEEILNIIEDGKKLDLGVLLGWGDISDHVRKGLESNKTADAILADRMTDMRNKAAETAASILADKLGIK